MSFPFRRSAALAATSLALALPVATLHAQRRPPTPASVIGFEPGTDRKLPAWKDVVAYFTALDAASPRVTLRTLGRTTLGRPFVAAFIGDSATLANLPRLREIQRRLADARLRTPGETQRLVASGKVVVLVTSSIHSTEVGGILTPLDLAHRLATDEGAEARAIRASTLVILVPSLNPDGVDIVGNWYRSTLGTPAEGTSPPELYHHYTGHDNNRDWYFFSQAETRLTVDSLHNVWHPEVVNDIHQQGSNAARIFIPPYMDPVEPNVDPLLTAGVNALGSAMAWRMTEQGFTGISINSTYDAWTPGRAYQHYHGGARILTETASARIATAMDIPWDSLRPGRGYDSKTAMWSFVEPWRGGRWGIGDIVRYQTAATWDMLASIASDRAAWLTSFAKVADRAIAPATVPGRGDWPGAYVIPATQRDSAALAVLLRTLQRGQVEIHRASAPIRIGGATYPAGSYVVPVAQPYGSFAKALLERQRYPDLREYPGGPPKRPYDVTAHTLPLLLGVDVAELRDTTGLVLGATIAPVAEPRLVAAGLSDRATRRIAIYRNYSPSMDEGWTRWVFDRYRIPFTSITDRDVRAGNLRARFDVILLPDQTDRELTRGAGESYPDSLKGGLGDAGAGALGAFVDAGGTLVALNEASDYAVRALALPVRDVLAGVPSREFYAPGSILAATLRPGSGLAAGVPSPAPIWFEEGPAFEITDSTRATAIASYTDGAPLLSGWLLGGEKLAGRAALVDVRRGSGHVVLFGFRPQYRGQSMSTFPLLWNALLGKF
ncbi:MAG TPA: M14 metallopeptidase family protein [Gemmatimonadaceae bacterium]|nr:M14 metallopeptidase family protein [Gemmatimonadaceae bacterium]